MNNINGNGVSVMPPVTKATNATASWCVDTKGFDAAVVRVGMNTHATNKAALATLKFSESDMITSPSSQTDIAALTGGTAISSSVGFVIPNATKMGLGAVIEFQIDLRKRKRYLGLQGTPGDTTANMLYAVAEFARPEQTKDTAAAKRVIDKVNTSSTQVALLVSA